MKRFNATQSPRCFSLLVLFLCVFSLPASPSWGQLPDNADALDRATRRMREAVQRIVVPSTALTNGPSIRKLFQEVMVEPNAWTVRVKCDGDRAALGAVVTPHGHIVTKASELTGQLTCRLNDGRELAAELVGTKPEFDLAVIKVEADDLPVVEWEDNLLHLGQWVATPDQGKLPASIGVLSVMARAIPKESGYLGIVLAEGEAGPRVTQVMPDSGAAAAGILIDDIVTHCYGKRTDNREKLIRAVREFGPGDEVKLELLRGEKVIKLSAFLSRSIQGWRPDRREVQNTMGGKLSERRQGFPTAIQHDTVLAPKDCGGAVVDLDGRAVGINVARAGRTETFAIPAATVKALLPALLSGEQTEIMVKTEIKSKPMVDPRPAPMLVEGTPPEPVE